MNNIKWSSYLDPATEEQIDDAEQKLNIKFPQDYREIAKKNHGGYPKDWDFKFKTPEGREYTNSFRLLTFDSNEPDYIVSTYEMMRDSIDHKWPESMIPIGETGDGDLICLDYSDRGSKGSPTVVLWLHEYSPEEAFVYLAESFTELLKSRHSGQYSS